MKMSTSALRSRRVERIAPPMVSGSVLNPIVLNSAPIGEIGRDEEDGEGIEIVAWTGSVERRPNDATSVVASEDEVCSIHC